MSLWFAWTLSPGDFLSIGKLLQNILGADVLRVKDAMSYADYAGAAISIALGYSVAGTAAAHELVHRTSKPLAVAWGRLMLALTADTAFAIEHVYGHHRNVATSKDAATARRGESVWGFLVRSTVMGYRNAWRIEGQRLRRRGYGLWTWRNRMLRGNCVTLMYISVFGFAAGWVGIAVFLAMALFGKSFLELINYVEHYGLIRVDGQPVEIRHSWNSNRWLSSSLLFNLPRHSHHHAEDDKPFWALRPYAEAPTLPFGYMGMVLAALIPPIWHHIMTPRILAWDHNFSSPQEHDLIRDANLRSGVPALVAAANTSGRPQCC